jgi:pimeloyl-ACP methyl ester carboxylesterase
MRHAPAAAAIALSLALLGAACARLPGDQRAQGVDGVIEISEIRGPSPTIVFLSGIGGSKEEWNKVFPMIAAEHQVFAYDRPGIGGSTATLAPRDGKTIAGELRTLLAGRTLAPPYILVGHSAGGLYAQLYARLFPGEVAGLVLVDPTHPTQFEGAGAMANRGIVANAIVRLGMQGATRAEFQALEETGQQVLAAPPLPRDTPIVILIAPDPSDNAIAAADNAKRADYARLYPGAVVRVVDGGHRVPQQRPQAVIDAINDVLSRGRVI